MKRLNIEITEEKKKELKVACAKISKSLKEIVTKLVDNFITTSKS